MTLIIAEAGVNHNGDEAIAFQLIDAAKAAGADIIKFQTFKAENLVTYNAVQCDYQITNSNIQESQYAMLKRLELNHEFHFKLQAYCQQLNIEFLSTAFDSESLDFLVQQICLKRLKIPSGEITNGPLLLQHARTGCDLILSTGMATINEVEIALSVLAFGLIEKHSATASHEKFKRAFQSKQGKAALTAKVRLLHCTTDYPTAMTEVNLRAIDTLNHRFKLSVGYSDHSMGISIPIAAVARGACIIEKHFTLNRQMPGPDHKASLEPNELSDMVQGIRDVEIALGDGIKSPQPREKKNINIVRKSLVAAKNIPKGSTITEDCLIIKRPGTGKCPMQYWDVIGTIAGKDYLEDELI